MEITAEGDLVSRKAAGFIQRLELKNAVSFEIHQELLKFDLDIVSVFKRISLSIKRVLILYWRENI